MDSNTQIIEKLSQRIVELECLVTQLIAENAELTKRLSKNSRNSSKPPSSDGLGKSSVKPPKSLREKGKKKSGGQPGHPGATLKQTATADKIVRHAVHTCSKCEYSLGHEPSVGMIKRQVFDIPQPTITVTEHQAEVKVCPGCHSRVVANFPAGINAPTHYGEVLQSYAVYLQVQQLLPEARLQQTFSDLFNVKLATATLNRFSEKVFNHLEGLEATVLSHVEQASLKHLDETGFRIAGKPQWLHVASTQDWTYYHHSPKRKLLLNGLTGTVVHDHWRPYYQLDNVAHVLCNAHHLRELKSLMEEQERWAHQMWRLLRFALRVKHHYGGQSVPPDKQQRLLAMYDRIIERGIHYHEQLPAYRAKPQRGPMAQRPGYNLLVRLRDYRCDATRFISEVKVPFTNNLAEQDLRMMKVKQKISGGFRSDNGASQFVRIRSFISTARKQRWGILDSISQAVAGNFSSTSLVPG